MTLIGEWSGKDDAEWRTELGYDRGLDRARAGLGYTRRFNKLQLTGFGVAGACVQFRAAVERRLARIEREAREPRAGDRRSVDGREWRRGAPAGRGGDARCAAARGQRLCRRGGRQGGSAEERTVGQRGVCTGRSWGAQV